MALMAKAGVGMRGLTSPLPYSWQQERQQPTTASCSFTKVVVSPFNSTSGPQPSFSSSLKPQFPASLPSSLKSISVSIDSLTARDSQLGTRRSKVQEGRPLRLPAPVAAAAVGKSAAAREPKVVCNCTVSTELVLPREKVPVDEYLKQTERIFHALFPDRKRSHKVSEDVWKVQVLDQSFFFFTVKPEVEIRVWWEEMAQPGKPPRTVLRLKSLGCTLLGLESAVEEAGFELQMAGTVYASPPRTAASPARVLGSLDLTASFWPPSALSMTPRPLLESAGSAVSSRILGVIKDRVNQTLVSDYVRFAQEMQAQGQSSVSTQTPNKAQVPIRAAGV